MGKKYEESLLYALKNRQKMEEYQGVPLLVKKEPWIQDCMRILRKI